MGECVIDPLGPESLRLTKLLTPVAGTLITASASKPDIGVRAGALGTYGDARREFETIRRQSDNAIMAIPSHGALVSNVVASGLRSSAGTQR